MLDSDLATLYGVMTGRLNEQVKRNRRRFPKDFAFQLTQEEFGVLMSQNAISNTGRGGRRKPPWVFTERDLKLNRAAIPLRHERPPARPRGSPRDHFPGGVASIAPSGLAKAPAGSSTKPIFEIFAEPLGSPSMPDSGFQK